MTNGNDWFIMSTLILVVIFLISLQLELSIATLMSGHSLGRQTSRRSLNSMLNQFTIGFVLITWLLFAGACLVVTNLYSILEWISNGKFWLILASLLLLQVIVMTIAHFCQPKLPHSWLPKDMRTFLTTRATKTKSPAEAFSLGVTSLLANFSILVLPFVIAAAVTMWYIPSFLLVLTSILFSLIIGLPLVIMQIFVLNDTPISEIQRFLIKNRRFFQIIRTTSLILLIGLIFCLITNPGPIL